MDHEVFLRQLLNIPQVWSAYLSPDKRWIAFVWYRRHPNMDVFIVLSDGSAPPVAMTNTPETTFFNSWTPDSQAVIVSEDHDRDERVRLFQVRLDAPGKMEPLTEDRPPYFMRGGDLSPDGRYLYYGANYDFAENKVLEPTWFYRHDLQTGEKKLIGVPKKASWGFSSLNKQGTHFLYSRSDRHPAGIQFHLVDLESFEDREILNFGDEIKVFAKWFPDGKRILVLSESTDGVPQEHTSLGIFQRASGKINWLIDDPKRNIENARVTPDGLIIIDEIIQAGHKTSYLDPETSVETRFPNLPGNLLPIGQNAAGEWVGTYYSSTNPTELVRFSPGMKTSDDLDSLTHVWSLTELDAGDLTPTETFHWNSEDGLEIQGWLYKAQPVSKRAIIYIHGGPTGHSEDALNAEIQFLVRSGYNVLDVNYRGSTGFGLKYREMIKEDGWGGREQVDIAAGADALIKAGLAEPGRIAVTGTSYGGYSSWWLITHYHPDLIAASAPICGMTDLVVDYETTRPDLRVYSEEMIGGTPQEVSEKYRERSPINYVQNIKGKLLVIQGAKDPNVTPENVREVETRLEEYQIPYEKLVFEDEGHGILRTKNQEILYKRLSAFFDSVI